MDFLLLVTIFFLTIIIFLTYFFIKINQKLKKTNEKLKIENHILKQYKNAIDESNIVSIGDLKGNIIYVNDKFCETTLYSRDEILGKSYNL